MSNSLAYHIRLACDFCDQSIEFDCWFLVDGAARPDLIEKAQAGTLHDCVCPHCFHVNRINSPLMLYRPQQTPVLLFSPADGSEHAENRKQISRMCGTLRKNLGDQWDESWFSGGVIAVLRNHLPAVLYGSSPYLQGQEVRNVRPGELLQELIDADQWEGTRKVIEENPDVLTDEMDRLLDEILRKIDKKGNGAASKIFSEYRELLQDCRNVGVSAAIARKTHNAPNR